MRLSRAFHAARSAFFFLLAFWGLFFGSACSEKEEANTPEVPRAREAEHKGPAWPALALLKTGENPLWFELGPDGPALIESPASASLAPYVPWPRARFVTGMRLWRDFLVMAVNRYGFLALGAEAKVSGADAAGPETAGTVLYQSADRARWDPYTTESLFSWEGRPAALLYRNDFFSEPSALPSRPQVFVLDESSAVPLPASVPALENFPPGGSWETEEVRRGGDGFWYYRMKEKGRTQNETSYFRAGSLTEEGEKISAAEWRNSGNPEGPEKTPPRVAVLLEAAAELRRGSVPVARLLSPDFEGQRLFTAAGTPGPASVTSSTDENAAVLYAYSRETPPPLAVAVFPDGAGLFSRGTDTQGARSGAEPFSLPALPQGFVYSGIALLGNVLLASWEEQRDAAVGAAGFMVVNVDFNRSN